MIQMTVRELIELLEELPQNYPVVSDCAEITEVVVRDEEYFTDEYFYTEGYVVKIL